MRWVASFALSLFGPAAHGRAVILHLLRAAHWLVVACACVLVARAIMDALILYRVSLRPRLLQLHNLLVTLTEPFLDPIRTVFRPRDPSAPDPSAFIALLLCAVLDASIVFVAAHL